MSFASAPCAHTSRAVLAAATVVLLVLRRGVVLTLLAAAAVGTVLVTCGLALPH